MNARILLIANLILGSLLLWPPEASLLSYRFSSPDTLLRMALSIWLCVGAILVGEHCLLRFLRARRARQLEETTAASADGDWISEAREPSSGERRSVDRRARNEGPPVGMPDRRRMERRKDSRGRVDDFRGEDPPLQHSR